MLHFTQGRVFRQVGSLRGQFAEAPGLPFAPLLSPSLVAQVFRDLKIVARKTLYDPTTTLWIFLSQVLDPVHCCLQAVARLVAYRVTQGLAACSSATGAYCLARQRLSEEVLAVLTRLTGCALLDQELPATWLFLGRPVKVIDGTTVSMPDTPANQKEFPQPKTQKQGVGFPLARMVVLFSLAVGTVLDSALGPYKGKQTSETALFRSLLDSLRSGDILLADRFYCSYWLIAMARERGVDVVFRQHRHRHVDFRRGRRLGVEDHAVAWSKPQRPSWMDKETYARLPDTLTLREVRVHVGKAGFRTDTIVVVTSLLDPVAVPKTKLAELYRARWHAELDLRSLKQAMQMDVLRCRTPAMVRKEVWAHLLAYNLIRTVMAQAAAKQGVLPRELSFKGALETILAFAPLWLTADVDQIVTLYDAMLDAIARHRVGNRPDRYEPRARKRRPKPYPLLTEPRAQARERLAKGSCG